MWLKLLALAGAAFPLPTWADVVAVKAWLNEISDELAEFVAALAEQIKAKGYAEIELPGGQVITMARGEDGVFSAFSDSDRALLCAAVEADEGLPRKWGDGKFLEMLEKLLPILIQILPLFLEPNPAPEPQPTPPPQVV